MGDGSEDLVLEAAQTPRPSRRKALWGALAALAVAGGALAVTAGGGDGDELQALPVGLGSVSAGGAESAMAADMSMAAWIHYSAGPDLPALGGEGPAYRLIDTADEEALASLAGALGLEGEPQRTPEGSWRLETEDGTLEVYEDGGGGWWFAADTGVDQGSTDSGSASSPAVTSSGSGTAGVEPPPDASTGGGEDACVPGPAVDCGFSAPTTTVVDPCIDPGPLTDCFGAVPTTVAPSGADMECITYQDSASSMVEECTSKPVPPAEDLPTQEEAERIALDLLAATGVDAEGAKVTVDGPYDAWYVTVEPALEGRPVAGWTSSVGVGTDGEVIHASGTLASAERLDDYPLITTTAAIDRLNAQSAGFGGAGPMPLPASETTIFEDASTDVTAVACVPQPDGREICEVVDPVPPADPGMICPQHEVAPVVPEPTTTQIDGTTTGAAAPSCAPPRCVDVVAPADQPVTTVPGTGCELVDPVPLPEPAPMPEPEPLEVVVTGAEQVLVLMPAIDGSTDTYLVPGYRLTSDDGHLVDVAAVPDALLAGPTTEETAPRLPEPSTTGTGMESPPCILTEEDSSGSTHTVVTDCSDMTTTTPADPEPTAG